MKEHVECGVAIEPGARQTVARILAALSEQPGGFIELAPVRLSLANLQAQLGDSAAWGGDDPLIEEAIAAIVGYAANLRESGGGPAAAMAVEPVAPGDFDDITGLRGPHAALETIRKALEAGTHTHVALIGVQSMKLINARFGRDVGDDALRNVVQAASATFREGDAIFRWHGPSFVALINASIHADGRRIDLIHATQLQHTVSMPSRQVMLSIRTAVLFRPLSQFSDTSEVEGFLRQTSP